MKRIFILTILAIMIYPLSVFAESRSFGITGVDGNRIGGIKIESGPHGSVMTISISKNGLRPGWHGIHIHQVGDCSDIGAFKLSKGHVNPSSKKHGFLNPDGPHPADLPNIFAASDGSVNTEILAPGVSLGGAGENLLDADGSAIVIHENPDDHMTQPIGGAGARIACAVIN